MERINCKVKVKEILSYLARVRYNLMTVADEGYIAQTIDDSNLRISVDPFHDGNVNFIISVIAQEVERCIIGYYAAL